MSSYFLPDSMEIKDFQGAKNHLIFVHFVKKFAPVAQPGSAKAS
jgi:hypothetical protein